MPPPANKLASVNTRSHDLKYLGAAFREEFVQMKNLVAKDQEINALIVNAKNLQKQVDKIVGDIDAAEAFSRRDIMV